MESCEPCVTNLKSKRVVDEEIIFERVCEFFNISAKEIKSKDRHRRLYEPRQIAIFLIKKNTNLSLGEIGKMFGNRDHTTVIHSANIVKNLLKNNEIYRTKFMEVNEYIFG